MATAQVVLVLDSGALISAEKNPRVEAILRKWLREGARVIVPAPVLAEAIRGGPRDAVANRLVKAIGNVASTSEAIARDAGRLLGAKGRDRTIDALVVATAQAHSATDILTTDPADIRSLASDELNVIGL